MKLLPSLQAKTVSWILTGTLAGLITGALWNGSQQAWERYLDRADYTGQQLYGALNDGAPLPAGVYLTEVTAPPRGVGRVTEASILQSLWDEDFGGARLLIQVQPLLQHGLRVVTRDTRAPGRLYGDARFHEHLARFNLGQLDVTRDMHMH